MFFASFWEKMVIQMNVVNTLLCLMTTQKGQNITSSHMVPQPMTIMTYNEIVTNPAPIMVVIVLLVEIVAQSDCIALFREIFGYWVKNIC